MSSDKYIGLDVHESTVLIAVLDSPGKLVLESITETKAATILQFFHGLRGSLYVTFEEGTCAAWLYDLLKPPVANKVLVCNPRKNALLKTGNKSDRIDARKLAELLRNGFLSRVYHGETGVRTLKELARSYLTINKDLTRVMNRLKALYRSRAIRCAGPEVYALLHLGIKLAGGRALGLSGFDQSCRKGSFGPFEGGRWTMPMSRAPGAILLVGRRYPSTWAEPGGWPTKLGGPTV